MTRAEEFETGHRDRVTVLNVNFTGERFLTASIDHKLKVWERDPETGKRNLIESWTAHLADVRDAKWFHPTTGSHIASVGNDLACRIWSEDYTQCPNKGKRFDKICEIPSRGVPFVSLDLKTFDSIYTYLALIDRLGTLSIYEPINPDSFREWTLVDQWNVCAPNVPNRGTETSFKVCWDPNVVDVPYMNSLSDEKNRLSVVVTALDKVIIYRSTVGTAGSSVPPRHVQGGMIAGGSKQMSFYEAASYTVSGRLVRDVKWAPFNVRGTDYFALACQDGSVRILELETKAGKHPKTGSESQASTTARAPTSSLTSAIAGRSNSSALGTQAASKQRQQLLQPFSHEITEIAKLVNAHPDAWAVAWDPSGQILMSSGTDSITKMWKQSVMGGGWLLFADQHITVESDDEDDDEMA